MMVMCIVLVGSIVDIFWVLNFDVQIVGIIFLFQWEFCRVWDFSVIDDVFNIYQFDNIIWVVCVQVCNDCIIGIIGCD